MLVIASQTVENIPIGAWFFLPDTFVSVYLAGKEALDDACSRLIYTRQDGTWGTIDLPLASVVVVKIPKAKKGMERRQIHG